VVANTDPNKPYHTLNPIFSTIPKGGAKWSKVGGHSQIFHQIPILVQPVKVSAWVTQYTP
jgi:hypothetical protein